MEKLIVWVKQIFVISILSELVIHLLPDEKYEGVVRLLCGCMITVSCAMPLIDILQNKYNINTDLFAFSSEIAELRTQIRFSGDEADEMLLEQYIQQLSDSVTQNVIDAGFMPSDVNITIDKDIESDTYLEVQKIEISIDKNNTGQGNVISQEIIELKNKIAKIYELNQGLVNIYIL